MPRLTSALLVTLAASGWISASQAGAELRPPPGYYAEPAARPDAKAKAFVCPTMPAPFTGTLDFPSKYEGSGKARDTLNEGADRRYKTLTQPITAFEKGATKLVDRYMDSGNPAVLQCVLAWYGGWASAGGLLGPATNHTGKSMRKWALGSLSGAWLRLQYSRAQPLQSQASQAAAVQAWLGAIGKRVVGEWDLSAPVERINNHSYWAAWAVMATSVVTQDQTLYDWALRAYRVFATQVDADGFLPNEIARQTRAAGYQVYAVTPLAMIAAFAKANGTDLADQGGQALPRAVQRALSAYDDPSAFAARTGQRQTLEGADEQSAKLAWLEPYCWAVTCAPPLLAKRDGLRPMKNSRLGGDLTAIYRQP